MSDENLKMKLTNDFKGAILSKNTVKKNVVQLIRASVLQFEKDNLKEATNDIIIDIISKQIKQKKDALEQFEKAGRDDLVKLTNREINILMDYIPEQLSIEEVKNIVIECRTALGDDGNNIGTLIKAAKAKIGAGSDGKTIASVVKEVLNG